MDWNFFGPSILPVPTFLYKTSRTFAKNWDKPKYPILDHDSYPASVLDVLIFVIYYDILMIILVCMICNVKRIIYACLEIGDCWTFKPIIIITVSIATMVLRPIYQTTHRHFHEYHYLKTLIP
jgi:hypothetical protein